MPELDVDLRNQLEKRVIEARDISEAAAAAALKHLGVAQKDAPAYLTEPQRHLRRALRAKARQLGDPLEHEPADPTPALERELAYERWHQMLFAAFLAHNDLLIHPTEKVPVTLQDCQELAPDEGDPDGWHTAARYASHMLPGIFKPTDPLLQVRYAPEDHQALERVLEDIPPPTYTSDDGLGWVYQFWQAKRKKQVNESGVKIGGADISPVTQLFTEHYMVQFLLHNSLGAWWTTRHPDLPLPTNKSYLRTLDDGTPAAGTFDGWPTTAKEITVMDPCCGSGHFLIAAFTLLQRFRMIEENLTEAEAGDAVLRDNLHGLELDLRCTQLAAFNLALHAWKHGGYRPLPPMNIACSGIPTGGSEADWTNLADDARAKSALKRLHNLFKNAPHLGSLMDPNRLAEDDPLYTANSADVEPLLGDAMATAEQSSADAGVFGEAARGIAHAARLLAGRYWLVTTNVPYLGRSRQGDIVQKYIDANLPAGRADLATAFAVRALNALEPGGAAALVTPANWLFLGPYLKFRELLLDEATIRLLARLGTGAFDSISGEVVNAVLGVVQARRPSPVSLIHHVDVAGQRTPKMKAEALRNAAVLASGQRAQLDNPHVRIALDTPGTSARLSDFVTSHNGVCSGDNPRWIRNFSELATVSPGWVLHQGPRSTESPFSGRTSVFFWQSGVGDYVDFVSARLGANMTGAWIRGLDAWGKRGVCISVVGSLNASLYSGALFTHNVVTLVPKKESALPAIWAFCSSPEYSVEVRKLNQKLSVGDSATIDVPFDVGRWSDVAAQELAPTFSAPYSDDPTQWLFHGHPAPATEPLQVAVARLLGYRWPAETDPDMELSDEARAWIARSAELNDLADGDGIVCLPPVAGEKSAAERLRGLLATAYGDQWSPTTEAALLATVDYDGKTLHDWLSGDFFKQHCKTFNNRPFIWHVSDGTKDGFSALVNYHKLDRALLERLIYTYLGSYIRQQQDAAKANTRGADLKLAKAEELKAKLELILEGEVPHDIFVRWKPVHEQPIGWEPDLNDGVRLNIRPFVTAGVLRSKFTINWNKDRGNDPTPNATGTTERHNDRHLTLAEKRAARAAKAT